MKIGDLFISLGIKADTRTLSSIQNGFKNLRTNLIQTQAAFAAAIYGLDRFVSGTVQGVTALQNLNQQTGLSIEQLQKWQQAGQLSNLALSADEISNSIGNLQRNIAAIKMGQGNIAPFQMLGNIKIAGTDAIGVLKQVRENIKNLDPGIATNLISQIGLDPGMINVLRLSNEEFDKLSKNQFLSKGQRDAVMGVGTSIKELTLRLGSFKDQAVAKLAPQLNRIVKDFFEWINKNSSKIIQAIGGIVQAIANFTTAVANAVSLAAQFLQKTLGLKDGLMALAAIFAVVGLSFSPFLLGLTAIILLLDDIKTWQDGGESLFGGFYDRIKKIKDTVTNIIKPFTNLKKAIGDTFKDLKNGDAIKNLSDLFKNAKDFADTVVSGIGDKIKSMINGLIEGYNSVADALHLPKLDNPFSDEYDPKAKVVGPTTQKPLSENLKKTFFGSVANNYTPVDAAPVSKNYNTKTQSATKNNNVINVSIHTSNSDPRGIYDQFQLHLNTAMSQLNPTAG